ncbi:MAG TPA: HoxN/HupN/NixA family nickel/cobalt transporter [Patescibacteria group bacterium]
MNLYNKAIAIISHSSLSVRKNILILITFLVVFICIVSILTIYFSKIYPLIIGLIILSFGLGLRHAVDADHIAAIDNTTRKFMHEGKKPVFVGLFFSLGHSTIVILLSLFLALSANFVRNTIPQFEQVGAIIGTSVSSFFLLIIGIINLITFLEIFHNFVHVVKHKSVLIAHAHTHLHTSGFLMKIFKPFVKTISKEWHMYFLGFLFGLGFDTASEIALLTISASSTDKLPFFAIMLLPLSFTAGMALIDSLDAVLMLGAYGWAFIKPIRKLYYNLTITFISVFIALFIGGLEALQLISQLLHINSAFFSFINTISISNLGMFIIILFILCWLVSIIFYKLNKFDKLLQ